MLRKKANFNAFLLFFEHENRKYLKFCFFFVSHLPFHFNVSQVEFFVPRATRREEEKKSKIIPKKSYLFSFRRLHLQ